MLGKVEIEQVSSTWKDDSIFSALEEFKGNIMKTFLNVGQLPFIAAIFDAKEKETRLFYVSSLLNDICKKLDNDPNAKNMSERSKMNMAKDAAKAIMQDIISNLKVDALVVIADAHSAKQNPNDREISNEQANAADNTFKTWIHSTLKKISENHPTSTIRGKWDVLFDKYKVDRVRKQINDALSESESIESDPNSQECVVITSHYSDIVNVENKYRVEVVPYTREKEGILIDEENIATMEEKNIPKENSGRFTFQI